MSCVILYFWLFFLQQQLYNYKWAYQMRCDDSTKRKSCKYIHKIFKVYSFGYIGKCFFIIWKIIKISLRGALTSLNRFTQVFTRRITTREQHQCCLYAWIAFKCIIVAYRKYIITISVLKLKIIQILPNGICKNPSLFNVFILNFQLKTSQII